MGFRLTQWKAISRDVTTCGLDLLDFSLIEFDNSREPDSSRLGGVNVLCSRVGELDGLKLIGVLGKPKVF